jgi:hypothetical protein
MGTTKRGISSPLEGNAKVKISFGIIQMFFHLRMNDTQRLEPNPQKNHRIDKTEVNGKGKAFQEVGKSFPNETNR